MNDELEKYKARMEGKKPGFTGQFTPGDSKPDYIDESGKAWNAKANESPKELVARAKGQKIPSKTVTEGSEEDDQV